MFDGVCIQQELNTNMKYWFPTAFNPWNMDTKQRCTYFCK